MNIQDLIKSDFADQPDINSSAEEIKEFVESSIHQDYLTEIDFRIAAYKEMLVDQDVQYSGREYDVFRGFIVSLRHLKSIFLDMYINKGGE